MVPLKLTVKNFLCYGEDVPPLDFEGIHVACLCGQNGHGKSALLDAITWALWGKARGRTQEELIRYGYSDMMVELEFMARDTHYRAARRHSVSGRVSPTPGRHRPPASDLHGRGISSHHRQLGAGDPGEDGADYRHGLRHLHKQRLPPPGQGRRVHQQDRR